MARESWQPNARHLAEFDLIHRHLAGDDSAFARLMEKYRARILRLAGGILNNAWDAEDACQMIFLKVYQNLHRFQGRSSFGAWLYRLSYNESLNTLRRLKRERLARQRSGTQAETSPAPAPPDEQLAADRRRDQVMSLLASLPAGMQDALVSVDLAGLAPEDAARSLGLRPATLRVRRHRAFKRLAAACAGCREALFADPRAVLGEMLSAA